MRTSNSTVRAAVVGLLAGLVLTVGWTWGASAQMRTVPAGASVYKQGGCIVCHKWHGMGGPGYGGTPINFRETILDRDQLIEVIACGRPDTGMPYHLKSAYKDFECFGGMTLEELGEYAPGPARQPLSYRQIKNVAEFIVEHFKGRSNELKREDCQLFFGESRMCTQLKLDAGGGGGGH